MMGWESIVLITLLIFMKTFITSQRACCPSCHTRYLTHWVLVLNISWHPKIQPMWILKCFQAKSTQQFDEWIRKLRHHRLYRQHEMAYGTHDAPRLVDVTSPVDDLTPITSPGVTPVLPLPNGEFKHFLWKMFFFWKNSMRTVIFRWKGLRSKYIGSCLRRVRLQRAPSYNKEISLHQNHSLQC